MASERGFFSRHREGMAIATLVGTTVGAGILAIPYVVAKAGFFWGIFLILLLGAAMLVLNLALGEVVLRTRKQHQLTGYAERYLGSWGKRLMAFSMLLGVYGALIAYLIGEGQTLAALVGRGAPWGYSLLFFGIALLILLRGMKAAGKVELLLVGLMFLVVFLTFFASFDRLEGKNLLQLHPEFFFLPYGVILFSYLGATAVPQMQEVLEKDRRSLRRALIIGTLLPFLLYVLFTVFIVGMISAEQFDLLGVNQRIATIALGLYTSPLLGSLANLIAVLTMSTSFLTLGYALVEMYLYDYQLRRSWAFLLTFFLPVLIVLLNLSNFIAVIETTGALAGGLQGILIMLMYWRAKKRGDRSPEYQMPPWKGIGWFLVFLFSLGIAYQFWSSFSSFFW